MHDPKTALPLSLGLGLLVGFGASQLLGGPAPVAPGDPDQGAAEVLAGETDPVAVADADAMLQAEIERLRAELAALGVDTRREATAGTDDPGDGTADDGVTLEDGDAIDAGPMLERLLDEFASPTYREAQRVAAEAQGPMSLVGALVWLYQNNGMHDDALRVLELAQAAGRTNQVWQVGDWNLGNLAQAFEGAGDRGTATRLYLEALRANPSNWQWAERLAELDPAGGLAVLRELELADDQDLSYPIASLLFAQGEVDQALAALRGDDGLLTPNEWDLYLEHAPESAEEALRAALGEDDPYGELGLRLARHLMESERTDEAIAQLVELLAAHPDNPEVRDLLSDLDPERGLALAEAEVARVPESANAWTDYADLLAQFGREEDALEARLRAFELSDGTWVPPILVTAAPDRVLPVLRERADRTNNDELWGDLADAYWRAGRHEEAAAAWHRARVLDSDDSEWIGKLDKLEQGLDPLGESGPSVGAGNGNWGPMMPSDPLEDALLQGYL